MKVEKHENSVVLTAETELEREVLSSIVQRSITKVVDHSNIDWSEKTNQGKKITISFRDQSWSAL